MAVGRSTGPAPYRDRCGSLALRMARLDQLPPDRRAVLQLLLKQGKSYGEIASVLRIERSAVKARAHDGLAALGPEDTELSEDRRDEIGDHLLGQQDEGQRAATHSFLEGSPAGRAWARVVSSELRELKPEGLPEIPAEGAAELAEAEEALAARRVPSRSARPGSAASCSSRASGSLSSSCSCCSSPAAATTTRRTPVRSAARRPRRRTRPRRRRSRPRSTSSPPAAAASRSDRKS